MSIEIQHESHEIHLESHDILLQSQRIHLESHVILYESQGIHPRITLDSECTRLTFNLNFVFSLFHFFVSFVSLFFDFFFVPY